MVVDLMSSEGRDNDKIPNALFNNPDIPRESLQIFQTRKKVLCINIVTQSIPIICHSLSIPRGKNKPVRQPFCTVRIGRCRNHDILRICRTHIFMSRSTTISSFICNRRIGQRGVLCSFVTDVDHHVLCSCVGREFRHQVVVAQV